MNWTIQYIGKKWQAGARGPDSFDCYGLIHHAYKAILDIELPNLPIDPSQLQKVDRAVSAGLDGALWTQHDNPMAFDAVGLGKGRIIHHLGLWIDADGGLVLHATDGGNVIAEPLHRLRDQFRRIEFYRHEQNN